MECPNCKKDTLVLVTSEAKGSTRQRSFLAWILWVVTFPFWGLWIMLFGRKTTYFKKQHYHCNYCGKDFPQEF